MKLFISILLTMFLFSSLYSLTSVEIDFGGSIDYDPECFDVEEDHLRIEKISITSDDASELKATLEGVKHIITSKESNAGKVFSVIGLILFFMLIVKLVIVENQKRDLAIENIKIKDSIKNLKQSSLTGLATKPIKSNVINSLNEREREVFELLGHGLLYKEIANALYIATNTVISHVRSIEKRLGVKGKKRLVVESKKYFN